MKIGFLGALGYHEETIARPIADALSARGADVVRKVGIDCDFFTESGRNEMGRLCNLIAAADLSNLDAIYLVDGWCLWLPIVLWNLGLHSRIGRRPAIYGMMLGSTGIPGDVAWLIPKAREYEVFLGSALDLLIFHSTWHEQRFPTVKGIIAPHPYGKVDANRIEVTPRRRVVYANRWAPDKGSVEFARLVEYAVSIGSDVEFVVTDPKATLDLPPGRVRIMGWLDQHGMRQIGREGGYVWAGARSELAAYSVHELISYGLHPLQSEHPAYSHLPERTRWSTPGEALEVCDSLRGMTIEEWDRWHSENRDNAGRIADLIIRNFREGRA